MSQVVRQRIQQERSFVLGEGIYRPRPTAYGLASIGQFPAWRRREGWCQDVLELALVAFRCASLAVHLEQRFAGLSLLRTVREEPEVVQEEFAWFLLDHKNHASSSRPALSLIPHLVE